MNNKPKVSIIIPVYNAERFLKETLTSVANQTFKDFECIIVNDGSTDHSMSIIDEFVGNDNRFICYTTINSGCADISIAYGVKQSISDCILVLAHDDYIFPNYVEAAYFRLCKTGADVICGQVVGSISQLHGELYRMPLLSFDTKKILSGSEAFKMTIGGWLFSTNGMLVNKSLFRGMKPGQYMNSDELSSRMIIYRANNVAFHEGIYKYRNHNESISRNLSSRLFERLIVDKQIESFVYSKYSIDSEIAMKERKTRLLNLVNLQVLFDFNRVSFPRNSRRNIAQLLREAYKSQDFKKLKKELRTPYILGFCSCYPMYRICAPIYYLIRQLKGKTYYYN